MIDYLIRAKRSDGGAELDERISRVRRAMRDLVRALDVEASQPLDTEWLDKIRCAHRLKAAGEDLHLHLQGAASRASADRGTPTLPTGSAPPADDVSEVEADN